MDSTKIGIAPKTERTSLLEPKSLDDEKCLDPLLRQKHRQVVAKWFDFFCPPGKLLLAQSLGLAKDSTPTTAPASDSPPATALTSNRIITIVRGGSCKPLFEGSFYKYCNAEQILATAMAKTNSAFRLFYPLEVGVKQKVVDPKTQASELCGIDLQAVFSNPLPSKPLSLPEKNDDYCEEVTFSVKKPDGEVLEPQFDYPNKEMHCYLKKRLQDIEDGRLKVKKDDLPEINLLNPDESTLDENQMGEWKVHLQIVVNTDGNHRLDLLAYNLEVDEGIEYHKSDAEVVKWYRSDEEDGHGRITRFNVKIPLKILREDGCFHGHFFVRMEEVAWFDDSGTDSHNFAVINGPEVIDHHGLRHTTFSDMFDLIEYDGSYKIIPKQAGT